MPHNPKAKDHPMSEYDRAMLNRPISPYALVMFHAAETLRDFYNPTSPDRRIILSDLIDELTARGRDHLFDAEDRKEDD